MILKRSTLILLGLALVLGVGFFALNLGLLQNSNPGEVDNHKLLQLDPNAVTRIAISGADGHFDLERSSADNWQLVKPIETAAEAVTVQNLLNTLAEASATTVEPSQSNSDQYGLRSPRETLKLTLTDRSVRTVKIGAATFDAAGLYAQVDNETIAIIPQSLQPRLAPSLFALRDKTLTAWPVNQLEVLTVKTADTTLKLTRTKGNWQIREPQLLSPGQEELTDFLNQLSLLQANGFVAETKADLSGYGLQPPQLSIEGTLATNQPLLQLSVGEPLPNDPSSVYATSSSTPAIATLPAATVKTWPTTLFALRDKTLGEIDPTLVGKVKIVTTEPERKYTLTRKHRESDVEPTDVEAGDSAASEVNSETRGTPAADAWLWNDRTVRMAGFFNTLREVRVQEFLPADGVEANRVLQRPTLAITLFPREGIAGDPLEIALAVASEQLYARSSQQTDVMVLEPSVLKSLQEAIAQIDPADSETTPPQERVDSPSEKSPPE
jgi:hypothetical protein